MLPFGLLGLLHLCIGWRIAPQWPVAAATALPITLVLSALLIPLAMTRRRTSDRTAADRWTWAGMSALGLFSMLLVLTLLRDIVLLLASPFVSTPLAALTAMAVPLLALLGVVLGLVNARRTARVKDPDLRVAYLCTAFVKIVERSLKCIGRIRIVLPGTREVWEDVLQHRPAQQMKVVPVTLPAKVERT